MDLKKKVVIALDVIIVMLVILATLFKTNTNVLSLISSKQLVDGDGLSFNLIASPEETRVKAGETVTIKVNVAEINVGQNGLNNVIGNLEYDESLFEAMNIVAEENWNIELNQREDHSMYGKFCIYTMQEGVTKDQDVVTMTLKLKQNLKPQTTEVKFLNLKSSDGNLSVEEQDRIVKIIIYEDEIPEEETPVTPQTGDPMIFVAVVVIGLTILLNILVFEKNKKSKILCSMLVLVIGLTGSYLASYAGNETIDASITQKIAKVETWLNSEKYLVTDDSITRVAPNTSVEGFKNKFNKNIKVYEKSVKQSTQGEENVENVVQENENDELVEKTSGPITTGMKVKVDDEQNEYIVGVVGDLDKDGDSNQVELTSIIRNVVNSTKWSFLGINAEIADMKLDGIIDEKDVATSVNYIVYGELEIPDFDPVKAPKIEITEGLFNENINAYEDDITIKITAMEENAGKTKYKIIGTTDKEYEEIGSGETFTITENGIYKILAYTYGKLGNRSEISSFVVSKKIATANYTVEHYKEELDGTYTKDEQATQVQTGRIGETATAVAKTYTGFSENTTHVDRLSSGKVKDDGSLLLKLYYSRNEYTLSLTAGENIESVSGAGTYKFGQTVDIDLVLKEIPSFIVAFKDWTAEDEDIEDLIENKLLQNTKVEIPAQNIELTANAGKEQIYNITYVLDGGVLETGKTNPSTYRATSENFTLNNPTKDEFRFLGWTLTKLNGEAQTPGTPVKILTINKGSMGDREYTANWGKTQYGITIHHYEEGTTTLVSPDEIIIGTEESTYEITTLLNATNVLKVAGGTVDGTRTYLDSNKYIYVNAIRDEANSTIDANGKISGTIQSIDQEITYYYHINKYQITGEVLGGNGVIEGRDIVDKISSEVAETVVYGENAKKQIEIHPNVGYRVQKIIEYTGTEIDGTYGTPADGGRELTYIEDKIFSIILPNYTNVVENKHIVVIFESRPVVAQIVAVPSGSENLIGRGEKMILNNKYYLLEDAIDDAIIANKNPGIVEIKILADIKDEDVTIEDGNNVMINLNGFKINSNSALSPTILIQEAEVIVKDDSAMQTGKIVSTKGIAVYVTSAGTFQMGLDVIPISQTTPLIQGVTYGVYKEQNEGTGEEGTFKFYDGKIIGAVAISGTVNDTPVLNNATVVIGEGANQVGTLAVVSNVEARIGKKTYMLLEDAIADANTIYGADGSQVEIVIVKDITKTARVLVDKTKNIKLDLNGYTLTSTVEDYVLENNGRLEVVDTILNDNAPTHVEAESANIVTGQVVEKTVPSGNCVETVKDMSFTFLSKAAKYKLSAQGYNMNRNSEVYLDGVKVYNFADSGITIDEYTSVSTINLGEVQAGEHTIRIKNDTENPSPIFDYFDVTCTSSGTITSTTGNTILNRYASEVQNGETVKTYTEDDLLSTTEQKFVKEITGEFKPNNVGLDNTTANSYIELDLRSLTGLYEIAINAEVVSEKNHDIGYATIKEDETVPIVSDEVGRFVCISGTQEATDYTKLLLGGRKYYLHLGYRKDVDTSVENETFTINSIKLNKVAEEGRQGTLILKSGTIRVEAYNKTAIENQAYMQMVNGNNPGDIVLHRAGIYDFKNKDGKLVSTNTGVDNSINSNYIEIDLTGKTGIHNLKVNAEISSQQDADIGYVTATESKALTCYEEETGRFINISGEVAATDYTTQLEGGKKYYLHMAYRRDGGTSVGSDTFTINSIKLDDKLITTVPEIAPYLRTSAVYSVIINNTGKLVIDDGYIRNVGGRETKGIQTSGDIIINDGVFFTDNAGKPLYILENARNTTINAGTFSEIYNRSKGLIINDIFTLEGNFSVENNKGKTIINNGSLFAIKNSGNGKIEINNGYNYGEIHLTSGNVDINNIRMCKSIDHDSSGKVTIRNGIFKNERGYNSPIALNDNAGTLEIYGGQITSNSFYGTIYFNRNSNNAIVNIYGGNIINTKHNAIRIESSPILNIYGGRIETTAEEDAILNGARGVVTVGKDDGTISTTSPVIISNNKKGINSEIGTINFYDGIIKGSVGGSIYGSIQGMPEGFDLVRTYEGETNNIEVATVGVHTTPVAKIGTTNYNSLQLAIDACSKTAGTTVSTIQLIANQYTAMPIVISEGQNIKIDFNGYTLKSYAKGNAIENNGTLQITDTTTTIPEGATEIVYGSIKVFDKAIINNNKITMSKINVEGYTSRQNGAAYITNIATAQINDIHVIVRPGIEGIMNIGEGSLNINGLIVTEKDGSNHAILNRENGRVVIDNANICISGNVYDRCSIRNDDTGEILIKNVTITGAAGINSNSISENALVVNGANINVSYTGIENQRGTAKIVKTNPSIPIIINGQDAVTEFGFEEGTMIVDGAQLNRVYIWGEQSKMIIRNCTIHNVNYNAININNKGTLTLESGTVVSNNEAGIANYGTLTLGIKDGTASETQPDIKGGTYGVYSEGTFNYYDGIIEGPKGKAITGIVTEKEEDYTIVKTTVDERETAVLQKIAVAEKLSTHEKYYKLNDAFESCGTSQEIIKVLMPIVISNADESIQVSTTQNIVLDLNGYRIEAGNADTIVNNGTFEIKSSARAEVLDGETVVVSAAEEGVGVINASLGTTLINAGTFKFTSGKITSAAAGIYSNVEYEKVIENTGTMQIVGGKIISTGKYVTAIGNSGNATLKINSGEIISSGDENYNILNKDTATMQIIDGTLTQKGRASINIYNNSIGKAETRGAETINVSIKILGGTFNNNVNTILENNIDNTYILITGGTFDAQNLFRTIYNRLAGNIEISNATLLGGDYREYYRNNSIENSSTGSIKLNSCQSTGVIQNSSTGNIEINGGTYISERYVLKNSDIGNVIISNGATLTSTTESAVTNKGILSISESTITGADIGIKNEGTVNMGSTDTEFDPVVPTITGTNYGITGVGITNYYSGKIIGNTAFNTCFGEVRENKEILVDKQTIETATLETITEVAQVGTTKYNTVQQAVNACTDGNNTIVLLKNIVVSECYQINIPSGKNVILDMNNKVITCSADTGVVLNEGTLEIKDTSAEAGGMFSGCGTQLIQNKGTLNLKNVTLWNLIGKERRVIYNTGAGILNTNNTVIKANCDSEKTFYVIYSDSTGDMNINNTNITINGYYYCDGSYNRYYSNVYPVYVKNESGETKAKVTVQNTDIVTVNGNITALYVEKGADLEITGTLDIRKSGGTQDTVTIKNITDLIKIYDAVIDINMIGWIEGPDIDITGSETVLQVGVVIGRDQRLDITDATLQMKYDRNLLIIGGQANITNANLTASVDYATLLQEYNENSIVNIINSTIENTSTGNAIRINQCGTVNITNSIISGTDGNGIRITSGVTGNINFISGEINSTNAKGISMEGGTLIIGDEDYPVLQVPTVTAGTYGIDITGGTFNFYDGKIIGATKAIAGVIADTPELYTAQFSENNTIAILGITATFEQVAQSGGIYYNTLQSAIDSATDVITIQKDIILNQPVTIPEGKTITIDLNAHRIKYNGTGGTIVNNGTLIIKDLQEDGTSTVEYGSIENYGECGIKNNGTLTIGVNNTNVYTNSPRILGGTYAVENADTKTFNFYDGTLRGITAAISGSITNTSNQTGYTVKDSSEVIGEGEDAQTYLIKYLGL